jgi:hypothetical protein
MNVNVKSNKNSGMLMYVSFKTQRGIKNYLKKYCGNFFYENSFHSFASVFKNK